MLLLGHVSLLQQLPPGNAKITICLAESCCSFAWTKIVFLPYIHQPSFQGKGKWRYNCVGRWGPSTESWRAASQFKIVIWKCLKTFVREKGTTIGYLEQSETHDMSKLYFPITIRNNNDLVQLEWFCMVFKLLRCFTSSVENDVFL